MADDKALRHVVSAVNRADNGCLSGLRRRLNSTPVTQMSVWSASLRIYTLMKSEKKGETMDV